MSQNKEAGSFGGNFFKDFYFSQGDYRWVVMLRMADCTWGVGDI